MNKDEKSGVISKKWFLIPLGIILLNIILGLVIYPSLPSRLPTHWDNMGNVDGYMNKSISAVFLMPLFQGFIGIIIYLSYFAIRQAKHHINPRDPEQSLKKNFIFRKVWSTYFLITLILVEVLFLIMNMMTLEVITNIKLFNIFSFVITGILLVWAVVLSLILGQGGDRLNLGDNKKSSKEYYKDDKHWKLKSWIYFNPEDEAVFVEKRVGLGWTVNIGRAMGLVLLVLPFIIVIISLIVVK